jgi:hypothetical protein
MATRVELSYIESVSDVRNRALKTLMKIGDHRNTSHDSQIGGKEEAASHSAFI